MGASCVWSKKPAIMLAQPSQLVEMKKIVLENATQMQIQKQCKLKQKNKAKAEQKQHSMQHK